MSGDRRRKSSSSKSLPSLSNDLTRRKAAVEEAAPYDYMFSFGGVRLPYLTQLLAELKEGKFQDIVLAVVNKPNLAIPHGTTVRIEHIQGNLHSCYDPITDKEEELTSKSFKIKRPEEYTLQELTRFCFRQTCEDSGLAYIYDDEFHGFLGHNFQGKYVICSNRTTINDLVKALEQRRRDEGRSPKDFIIRLDFISTDTLALNNAEDPEHEQLIEGYMKSTKQALRLFDQRLILLDDFDNPLVMNEMSNLWKVAFMARESLIFDIVLCGPKLTNKMIGSGLRLVVAYQTPTSPKLLAQLDDLDLSMLSVEESSEVKIDILTKELTNGREGLRTSIKSLKQGLIKCLVSGVKDDVNRYLSIRDNRDNKQNAAKIRFFAGDFMRRIGELDQAREYLNEALKLYTELTQSVPKPRPIDINDQMLVPRKELESYEKIMAGASKTCVSLGLLSMVENDHEQALAFLENANEFVGEEILQVNYFYCDIWEARAKVFDHMNNKKGALACLQTIAELLQDEEDSKDRIKFADAQFEIAKRLKAFKDIKSAIVALELALVEHQRQDNVIAGRILLEMGSIQFKNKKYEEGLSSYLDGLEVIYKNKGKMNEEVAIAKHTLGLYYTRMKKFPEAIKCYRESINLSEITMGPNCDHLQHAVMCEGILLMKQKNFDEAKKRFKRAISCLKDEDATAGNFRGCNNLANAYSNLGQAQEMTQEIETAEESYHKAYELTKLIAGEEDPRTLQRKKRWEKVKNLTKTQ